ncbi:hypothetical protein [Pseudoalteromonas aurantia]|uniref:hypothetical protein n=1 Tax=Pseudoalteromonas aurantia TaxID=43654 RepID=UPI001485D971|nr:hypothetical protein [Pseudoalteromonas aurantia]
MVKSFLDSGQLMTIFTEFITPFLEVSLVYAQARLTNPVLNAFILLSTVPVTKNTLTPC